MLSNLQAKRYIEPATKVPILRQVLDSETIGRYKEVIRRDVNAIDASKILDAQFGGDLQPSSYTTANVEKTRGLKLFNQER